MPDCPLYRYSMTRAHTCDALLQAARYPEELGFDVGYEAFAHKPRIGFSRFGALHFGLSARFLENLMHLGVICWFDCQSYGSLASSMVFQESVAVKLHSRAVCLGA